MDKTSKLINQYTDKKYLKLLFPFFASGFSEFCCIWLTLPAMTVGSRVQNNPDYKYTFYCKAIK
jgi:hypothetical protein